MFLSTKTVQKTTFLMHSKTAKSCFFETSMGRWCHFCKPLSVMVAWALTLALALAQQDFPKAGLVHFMLKLSGTGGG